MRVSEFYEYEFSEIDKLLQHLENIYLRENFKKNWGCS